MSQQRYFTSKTVAHSFHVAGIELKTLNFLTILTKYRKKKIKKLNLNLILIITYSVSFDVRSPSSLSSYQARSCLRVCAKYICRNLQIWLAQAVSQVHAYRYIEILSFFNFYLRIYRSISMRTHNHCFIERSENLQSIIFGEMSIMKIWHLAPTLSKIKREMEGIRSVRVLDAEISSSYPAAGHHRFLLQRSFLQLAFQW